MTKEVKAECNHAYYLKNRDSLLSHNRNYSKTPSGKKAKLEGGRRNYQRIKKDPVAYAKYRLTINTSLKVLRALRKGVLQRGPCEVCGSIHVHGHHDNYDKPLSVRWLCPSHHEEYHLKLTEG